ncbi:MAG: hypothetical protein ACRDYA_12590 [Egibacteraceae bacterium]
MAEPSAPPDMQAPEEDPVEPVTFGLWWPAGDPDKLREAADAWDAMASHLDTATATLSGAASAVTGANSGAAIDAFANHWELVGGSQGAIPAIAGDCRAIAASLREFADAVDEVREQILQMAVEIAATVAIGVGLAVLTAGLSAGAAGATTAAMVARAAALGVNLGIRAATIISRVAIGAGVGAVEGMAANTVVQLGSNAVFNDNHDPLDGFSMGEVWTSGAFGFAGGGAFGSFQALRALRPGALRPGMTQAERLAANSYRGAMGEDMYAATVRMRGGTVLGRRLTVYSGGTNTRVQPDFLVRDPDGTLRFIDVKTGPNAPLTPNQRIGYPEIRTQGGVPRGANADEAVQRAGLRPGDPMGSTPVDIHRWKW